VELRILGPLEVVADGAPIMPGPTKQRALLGVLLLHANEVVSSERLVDELWGARPPPTAPKLIQVYVSQLRKTLVAAGADDVLRTRAPGYVAVLEAEQLDAARFTGLLAEARAHAQDGAPERAIAIYAAALALWRGPVLSDLTFESQARVDAERLAELRLAAIGERIDCELACGRHAQLIGELESLTAQHSLHERFWAQLMLALYRSGRQSDALHAYQQARRTLVDQVGLEPGPQLQRLEKAMLAHDSSLDATKRPRHAGVAPKAATTAPTRAARRRLDRRRLAIASFVLTLAAAAAAATAILSRDAGFSPLAAIEPDSIGIVDPGANALVADIPLHTKPAALAYGAGRLWVATERDRTLLKIDPHTKRVTRTIGLGATPTALAIGGRNVWVLCGSARKLFQFNGHTGQLVRRIAIGGMTRVGPYKGQPLPPMESTVPNAFVLAAGAGAAWIGYGGGVVLRVDARTGAVEQIPAGSARGVAFGAGAGWSVSSFSRSFSGVGVHDVADGIWRIMPTTRAVTEILRAPDMIFGGLGDGLVAGADALWMINAVFRTVLKIDPASSRVTGVIHLQGKRRPVAVAVGPDGVWVGNTDATISRIEPHRAAVVRTIPLGRYPRIAWPVGVATGGGVVWVAVH
jgi:DNA-binding SARP family transcriptional activator